MWYIRRIDPLQPLQHGKYFSFTGAGGKSSLIECIARRAAMRGKTVAITTTTKIYAKEPYLLFDRPGPVPPGSVIRVGKTLEGEKLTGLTFNDLQSLGDTVDLVLIEADGAKHCPLKYPAPHEPLIPPFSDMVFVVAGLDGLHGRVDDRVFRWEIFRKEAGIPGDANITEDVFLRLFSEKGLLKCVDRHKCTVVLNKYDMLKDRRETGSLAKKIMELTGCRGTIVSSVLHDVFYMVTRS